VEWKRTFFRLLAKIFGLPHLLSATQKPQNHVKFVHFIALFAWLISHQPAVLFSQNKPATSNQPAVIFSQNKPAPAISHQPTEQAEYF
jgi:hypothetical protein